MALVSGNLISDATLLCFPYVHEDHSSPGMLCRVLTQLEKEVIDMYILTQPQVISVAGTPITVVASQNAAGYALTAAKNYTDFSWITPDGFAWEIYMVPERHLLDKAPRHPAGIVRGNTFFPADPLMRRWNTPGSRNVFVGSGDQITYRYIPEPANVTGLAQTLASPDAAQPYLMWSLALTMLLTAGAPTQHIQNAAAQRDKAKAELTLIASKTTGV